MKNDKLQNALGEIGDDLIAEAAEYKRPKRKVFKATALIAACLALVIGCVSAFNLTRSNIKSSELSIPEGGAVESDKQVNESVQESLNVNNNIITLCKAQYPDRIENPNINEDMLNDSNSFDAWHSDWYERRNAYYDLAPDISDFVKNSVRTFTKGSDNSVYSPINVYMALSLLAESTDGESRDQILSALGCDSIDSLRKEARVIWDACYYNDGASNTLLGNSLWLNEGIEYKKDTLDILCNNYYASSFQGKMGSDGMNVALRQWLNEQTGDLLKDQINSLSFDPATVLGLASTVYFNGQWSDKFMPERTSPDSFYTDDGEITCDFMHESSTGDYFTADSFTAVSKPFNDVGNMLFILPDKDSSVAEVIASDELYDFIACNARGNSYAAYTENDTPYWQDSKYAIINLSLPKFDVSSQINLTGGLKELGITDVFDSNASDFSPITDEKGITLGEATHGARVKIDEEGCEAAAYTLFLCGTGAVRDEIDFVLDRPFIFVINSAVGVPLFVGTVNNP